MRRIIFIVVLITLTQQHVQGMANAFPDRAPMTPEVPDDFLKTTGKEIQEEDDELPKNLDQIQMAAGILLELGFSREGCFSCRPLR